MSKLWAFTVQVEAEARWERNRAPARSSSLPVGSDHQRGIRQGEPDDDSPRCKTRRALSPSMSEVSAFNTSSTAVSSPVPHSHLYGGRPPLLPLTLRQSNFADNDFIPSASQSILVATQEYPASLSWAGRYFFRRFWVALLTSPVSMIDAEPAVISVNSSDSDPDLSDELWMDPCHLFLPASLCMWWSCHHTIQHRLSPSCYLHVQISPNLVREDCSSVTLYLYPG